MGLFKFLKTKSKKDKIINKYYAKYPEIPFIDDNRNFEQWEQLISFDSSKLVDIDKMKRNQDGLLPGHVYQIYWLDKYKSDRRIPVYFEYEYGIDFEKEKSYLEANGYIKDYSATDKGKYILDKYSDVITEKNSQNSPQKMELKKILKDYDKEAEDLKCLGLTPSDTKEERTGFVYQQNAIVDYKNKDFESAKKGFLTAVDNYNFYTPGGIEYLAKIFRKEKDYKSEIEYIEKALVKFNSDPEVNWSKSTTDALKKRLEKAKQLLNK